MLPLLPQLLGLDEFASVVTSWNQYKSGGKGNDRSNVLSAHSTLKINTATKTDPEELSYHDMRIYMYIRYHHIYNIT